MGLLETIKDTVSIIQKADNLDLYRQILDIQREALEQQEVMHKLQDENRELKEKLALKGKIIRHREPVITLEGDPTPYCAVCYGKENKLIQLKPVDNNYWCQNCGMGYIHTPID